MEMFIAASPTTTMCQKLKTTPNFIQQQNEQINGGIELRWKTTQQKPRPNCYMQQRECISQMEWAKEIDSKEYTLCNIYNKFKNRQASKWCYKLKYQLAWGRQEMENDVRKTPRCWNVLDLDLGSGYLCMCKFIKYISVNILLLNFKKKIKKIETRSYNTKPSISLEGHHTSLKKKKRRILAHKYFQFS